MRGDFAREQTICTEYDDLWAKREREMISSIEEIEKIRMMETKIWEILKKEY